MISHYDQQIFNVIEPCSKVLDLGCGDGALLHALREQKQVTCYGIEIDFDNILACISKGLSVYQGNIDEGLPEFSDLSYDYVILSHTLQQIHKPLFVLSEILRVGKKAIVSFPNFGHWKIRFQYCLTGQAPKSPALPYNWYDTPNIRILTIQDFKNLCHQLGFLVQALGAESNLFSEKGVFLLEKSVK